MNGQDLKNSILQLAIQGKLVEQREEEGTAKELLNKIEAEKKQLIKEGKIKKQKKLQEIREDEIPFEIPDNWEWVRLNDIALFIKAGGDKPKDFTTIKSETHSVPVIANGIQNDGIIGYTKNATIEDSCITVSGRGTIGFSCLRTEPFSPVVRLLVLNISNKIEQKYIQNVLTALLERGVGTSIKQLTVPMLKPKLIPLPPLEEQKRIVAKIEELMPYVDKYDIAYSEVEELNKKFPEDMQKSILQYAIQGKLVEQREEDGTAEDLYKQIQEEKKKLVNEGKIKKTKVFTEVTEDEIPFDIPESWKWVRLGEIGSWSAGATPSRSNPQYYVGDIPWLKTGDLNDGYISEIPEHISTEALKKTSVRLNPIGSVLMAMYGATIGKLGILNIEATTNQACCACIPFKGIYNKFLFYYLLGQREYYIKMGAGGAQPNISKEKIVNSVIPLPPLEEQKRIVDKIEELLPYCKQLVK